jgi:hypothetical protein
MKKPLVLALVLAVAPCAASARDSLGSYTYVEGGFSRLNVDNDATGDIDFNGGYLRTSIEMGDALYLLGGLAYGTSSDLPVDVDAREAHLGLGYKHTFADNFDLTVETAFQRQELDDGNVKDVLNNTRLGVGVRGAFTDNLEGWVKVNYVDGGAYDGDFVGTLGAQVVINETWGIVGEVDAGGDVSRYGIGIRASF